jgi:hypothetical protein
MDQPTVELIQKKLPFAKSHFEKSLRIHRKTFGLTYPRTLEVELQLAITLKVITATYSMNPPRPPQCAGTVVPALWGGLGGFKS